MIKEKAGCDRQKYLLEIEELRKKLDIDEVSVDGMVNILATKDVMYRLAIDYKLCAITVESFMSIPIELGACISFAQAEVSDMGVPCVCESDIHGAISSIIAEAVALNTSPSFFADLTVRHPENDNGLLLWHDSFPLSLKAPDCRGSLGKQMILPEVERGMCHWKIKDGEITIIRFDGEADGYRLLAEKANSIPGPYTQSTYLWVELDNWKGFERKIIEGPYIHHASCIYGDYKEVLREACKYIDGLQFDTVE